MVGVEGQPRISILVFSLFVHFWLEWYTSMPFSAKLVVLDWKRRVPDEEGTNG